MLREILRRGWYHTIDEDGGGSPPPEDEDALITDADDDGADDEVDPQDDLGDESDEADDEDDPAPPPAIDPKILAQAFVEAQKELQRSQQKPDEPAAIEFDWSDPVGSVNRIVAAATSGLTKDAQDRRGLEDQILGSLKGRPQETIDFARGVLANTPTEQLRHPEAAKTLKWMALGFEAENVPKKVKQTVKAEPAVPKKSGGGGSAEVQKYIRDYEAAFPKLKGRMTVERAKKILGGE